MDIRDKRKDEHLVLASITKDGPSSTGFEDIQLIHQAVVDLNLDEVDLVSDFKDKKMDLPVIVNAITGGTTRAGEINKTLARLAKKYNIAMAVGSQTIAIKTPELMRTFDIVRAENPEGVIIANIGANEKYEKVKKAIDMVAADAVQLHFNIPQELAMREGDRNFKGIIKNVQEIVEQSPVPVIAKEVGFGLSKEAVRVLFQAGVETFDIGGKGGTNFITIEDQRKGMFGGEFDDWGIPTAYSLGELASLKLPITIIASGGIRTTLDAVKALAMGADYVGIAGSFLKLLINQGEEELDQYINGLIYRLKAAFLMTDSRNITELQEKPLIIMGKTAAYLQARANTNKI